MPYKIFGCKVNKFYINQRLQYYKQHNINLDNTLLIATCVVTDRAKNKRLKESQKALKSWMQVAITGCGTLEKGKLVSRADFFAIYPELEPHEEQIELLWETAPSFAPRHSEERGEALAEPNKPVLNDEWRKESLYTNNSVETYNSLYTKHFVMIQNGCDNHCSFCLTVKKRGPHRSRPLTEIIEEIKLIETQGGKEIVLTWINLMARGASNTRKPAESRFPQLLEAILKQTTIPRIRISSIWPEYASDHFFEVITEERIMPHFHYSIQSFSDNVLKLMNRNYNAKLLDKILKKTKWMSYWTPWEGGRSTERGVWADLIVGFPGETEADFLETLQGIETYAINKLHIFPFSPHHKGETVPASLLPNQVEQAIKKERESRLLQLWEKIRNDFITNNKGIPHQILIEEKRNGKRRGRTENYIQVELEGDFKKGEIVSWKIESHLLRVLRAPFVSFVVKS